MILECEDVPLTDLTEAQARRTCEALLTLHPIADEASGGLRVALDASYEGGVVTDPA